jgi:hypothetical protein
MRIACTGSILPRGAAVTIKDGNPPAIGTDPERPTQIFHNGQDTVVSDPGIRCSREVFPPARARVERVKTSPHAADPHSSRTIFADTSYHGIAQAHRIALKMLQMSKTLAMRIIVLNA